MTDIKKVTNAIIEGKDVRSAISEGYFSNVVIELSDDIADKLEKLKAEDPLFNDKDHKSYTQNKKDFDEFLNKLKGFGVDTSDLLNKITTGKENIRWAEVWTGLLDNLTK